MTISPSSVAPDCLSRRLPHRQRRPWRGGRVGASLALAAAVIAAALLAAGALGCSGDGESPATPGSTTGGSEPARSAAAASSPTPAPSPTPKSRYSGFDLDLSEGTFWEYRWTYTDRSCAQGSGCSTDEDSGVFQVTLGERRTIEGIPVHEVIVTGKHAVSLSKVNRDFAPKWRYLGVAGDRIVGSDGAALTTIFDGITGKWAGSGYFTDRFDSDELVVAKTSSLTDSSEIADWPGVRKGPWVFVSRAASQSQCEMIAGLRICPREEAFDFSETEYYREGVGPLAYNFRHSASFSGGSFFSSYQTAEWVALVGSSLRGDVAERAAAPTATPAPVAPIPTSTPQRTLPASAPAFGPVDGSLAHDPADDMIPDFSSGVSLGEAAVEVSFVNPDTPRWSYGFSFRQSEEETFHAVYVNSDGRWMHFARGGTPESQVDLGSGLVTLRRGPGASNHLMVIFSSDAGWFFVNGEFIAELDLSLPEAAQDPGDVRVFGAVNLGDETAGEATVFSDFTIRPLERVFGPRSFDLAHNPGDGELAAVQAGVDVADGIVEATLSNPRPTSRRDWTHVVLFRAAESSFHTFVLSGTGQWIYARGGDVIQGPVSSSAINTASAGANRVRLIMAQNSAWFFVNDRYLGRADFGGGAPSGDVEAVGALEDQLEIAGAVTHISDFTVWSFD